MKRWGWLFCGCFVVSNCASAVELYRWVDEQGKVHYGDVPAAGAGNIESKKLITSTVSGDDLPYATRRAQQSFPVTLYVSASCGDYCVQARNLLQQRGIPYSEKILVTQADVATFKQQTGTDRVPVLQVGKNYLLGLQEFQWHTELDSAGYPKAPDYRQIIKSHRATSSVAPAETTVP